MLHNVDEKKCYTAIYSLIASNKALGSEIIDNWETKKLKHSAGKLAGFGRRLIAWMGIIFLERHFPLTFMFADAPITQ